MVVKVVKGLFDQAGHYLLLLFIGKVFFLYFLLSRQLINQYIFSGPSEWWHKLVSSTLICIVLKNINCSTLICHVNNTVI